MTKHSITRLLASDGTWDALESDWRRQCQIYNENFDEYASGTFAVVKDIIDTKNDSAGVFAFRDSQKHLSLCQINTAGLPGYSTPVMRIRYLTLCPDLDFGDAEISDYAETLITTLAGVIALAKNDNKLNARHIKFHLASPADRPFFASLGSGLNESEGFESVQMRGAWLYMTLS